MSRNLRFFAGIVMVILMTGCSGEKKSGAGRPRVIEKADASHDSTVWYDSEIGTRQRSYRKELQGNWKIAVMHRQQKSKPEVLDGVSIAFTDSSFSAKAPCNPVAGVYLLKGTSIKFTNLHMDKNTCPFLEQETALVTLLEKTVSAYSVSAEKLLLRDGASNIVFECERLP